MTRSVAIAAITLSACADQFAIAPTDPTLPAAAGAPGAAIRGPAGNLPVRKIDGSEARLADYGADVTVVALWAPWCASCRNELPCLEELRRMYQDDPSVAFVAVALGENDGGEDAEHVQTAASRLGLMMPVLIDHDGDVMQRLGRPGRTRRSSVGGEERGVGLPVVLVIDREFKIDREMGWGSGSHDAYIETKRLTIEAAKKGRLVARDHTADPNTTPKAYDRIKIQLPPEAQNDLDHAIPNVRLQLKGKWPHLTEAQLDALMRRIEPGVRRGEATTVEIPGPER